MTALLPRTPRSAAPPRPPRYGRMRTGWDSDPDPPQGILWEDFEEDVAPLVLSQLFSGVEGNLDRDEWMRFLTDEDDEDCLPRLATKMLRSRITPTGWDGEAAEVANQVAEAMHNTVMSFLDDPLCKRLPPTVEDLFCKLMLLDRRTNFFFEKHGAVRADSDHGREVKGMFASIPNSGASRFFVKNLNHFGELGGFTAILTRIQHRTMVADDDAREPAGAGAGAGAETAAATAAGAEPAAGTAAATASEAAAAVEAGTEAGADTSSGGGDATGATETEAAAAAATAEADASSTQTLPPEAPRWRPTIEPDELRIYVQALAVSRYCIGASVDTATDWGSEYLTALCRAVSECVRDWTLTLPDMTPDELDAMTREIRPVFVSLKEFVRVSLEGLADDKVAQVTSHISNAEDAWAVFQKSALGLTTLCENGGRLYTRVMVASVRAAVDRELARLGGAAPGPGLQSTIKAAALNAASLDQLTGTPVVRYFVTLLRDVIGGAAAALLDSDESVRGANAIDVTWWPRFTRAVRDNPAASAATRYAVTEQFVKESIQVIMDTEVPAKAPHAGTLEELYQLTVALHESNLQGKPCPFAPNSRVASALRNLVVEITANLQATADEYDRAASALDAADSSGSGALGDDGVLGPKWYSNDVILLRLASFALDQLLASDPSSQYRLASFVPEEVTLHNCAGTTAFYDGAHDSVLGSHEEVVASLDEHGHAGVGHGQREVIVVDVARDAKLRGLIELAKGCILGTEGGTRRAVRAIASELADIVAGTMGGTGGRGSTLADRCRRFLDAKINGPGAGGGSGSGGANVHSEILLGDIEVGVCRHRAVLFKVLADAVGLPCALVRGEVDGMPSSYRHAWNVVRVPHDDDVAVGASGAASEAPGGVKTSEHVLHDQYFLVDVMTPEAEGFTDALRQDSDAYAMNYKRSGGATAGAIGAETAKGVHSDIREATDIDVDYEQPVGMGAMASVYPCTPRPGIRMPVSSWGEDPGRDGYVVKQVNLSALGGDIALAGAHDGPLRKGVHRYVDKTHQEIQILRQCRHRNIVPLRAAFRHVKPRRTAGRRSVPEQYMSMVLDNAKFGSVKDYITSVRLGHCADFTDAAKTGIALDAALALLYLHGYRRPRRASRAGAAAAAAAAVAVAAAVEATEGGADASGPTAAVRSAGAAAGAGAESASPARVQSPRSASATARMKFRHRRIIHKDVKPGNLLIGATGNAWLADFGVSSVMKATDTLSKTMTVAGTPLYWAREVREIIGSGDDVALGGMDGGSTTDDTTISGKAAARVTHKSDIWALGQTIAFLFTGREPPLLPPWIIDVSGAPDAIREVYAKCTQDEPAERPDAAEVVTDLLEALIGYTEASPDVMADEGDASGSAETSGSGAAASDARAAHSDGGGSSVPTAAAAVAAGAVAAAPDVASSSVTIDEKSVDLVVDQAACSRDTALRALQRHGGDIVNAIMELTM